jgi:hypothetical protein
LAGVVSTGVTFEDVGPGGGVSAGVVWGGVVPVDDGSVAGSAVLGLGSPAGAGAAGETAAGAVLAGATGGFVALSEGGGLDETGTASCPLGAGFDAFTATFADDRLLPAGAAGT